MSHEISKRYRPKLLNELVACDEEAESLDSMLAKGKLPHSLLIYGPSGCGKTTIGRIVRGRLKCSDMDFREMNSAQFRGIDTIRDIQAVYRNAPAAGPCRVWLLDECHHLSGDAQTALLKMLEDTPDKVYFILCTTNPEKLIPTVRNRCHPVVVRSFDDDEMGSLLSRVLAGEKAKLKPKICDALIASSAGCPRTLLVCLEKVLSVDPAKQAKAIAAAAAEQNEAIALCRALIAKRPWKEIAQILRTLKGEPENTRWSVLGYASAALLNNPNHHTYLVLSCFKDNFYDSKKAGLVHACFEAIHGE